MPVSFANPALLLGALAAVLPVVIHLLSRRRVRRLPFSDLRFLREVQTRQSRSLGIRRWLLLLLRVLALLCIALAVARPHWGGLAPSGGGGRSVLFVLDASASMATQQGDRTRFAAAVELCTEMIASLPDDSTVQVLLASARIDPLFADWLPVGILSEDALQALAPTDGGFNLAALLREAARQVATAPGTPVQIVLLSDLQLAPLPADLAEAVRLLRAAGESTLLVHQVGQPTDGGGVLRVDVPRRAVRPGETAVVTARVTTDRPDQACQLDLGGRRVAEAVVAGPAGQDAEVAFSLVVPPVGLHAGWVRKPSDRFAADDARPFVLDVREQVSVLLIHGEDRDTVGRGGWRYLATALAPDGDASGLFRVRAVTNTEVAAGDLAEHDVVLLVDPEPLGRQFLGGLLRWLKDGGAAALWIGDPTLSGYLTGTLLPALALGTEAPFVVREQGAYERLVVAAPDHALLRGFGTDAIATLEDLSWWRYYALTEGTATVLLTVTGGAPLLLETELQAGRCLVWATNLRREATDLARSPMFLPLMQRQTAYLAWRSMTNATGAIAVGEAPAIRIPPRRGRTAQLDATAELQVTAPASGGANALSQMAQLIWSGTRPLLRAPASDRAGFFTFTAAGDTVALVAAAVPAAESILALQEVDAFRDELAATGLLRTGGLTGPATGNFAAALSGRELAPWLLLLAVMILLLESYLGRGSERRGTVATGDPSA